MLLDQRYKGSFGHSYRILESAKERFKKNG
jgi:hypothetical protein